MGDHELNMKKRATKDGGDQKGGTLRGKVLDKHGNLVPKNSDSGGGKHAKPDDGGKTK